MNFRTLLALTSVLVLASCTGSDGIFASIEDEEKIVSLGGLSETATVTHMAESTTLGMYFAAGGRALFSRSSDSSTTDWDSSTVGGSDEVIAVGTTGGSTVWAVASEKLWKSTDGSSWTEVPLSTSTDAVYDLVPIRTGDGYSSTELLVVTKDTDDSINRAYRIGSDGTTFSAVSLVGTTNSGGTISITSLRYPVVSAVFDGTDYYLVNENYLWRVNSSFSSASVVDVSGPTSGYRGLIYVDDQGFYLTTRSNGTTGGGIYTSAVGGDSISFTTIVSDADKNSVPLSFGSLLYNEENLSLWVATEAAEDTYEGQGYVEVTLPDDYDSEPRTDSNNYESSDIVTSAVGTFFLASDGTYFLGTVAHGLWTWEWAGTDDDSTWSQQ